ncbi:predicted protein [Nematostella vectensis]|uniref:RING-type domain-containing protein n=1 Tax=Nematostella vectensis TaxID=45351 RepID=A7SUW9_NEMVE|nr:predicted protein [Nematostella vectensis]|eukprot:XP_001624582.1 predicted protein [Nematostella vectensis]
MCKFIYFLEKGRKGNNLKSVMDETGASSIKVSTRKFGEIKELILGMLNTYNYESTLLKTTNQLLAKDLHSSMSALRSNRNRGLAPVSTVCGMCHHSSSSDARKTGKVAILRCGHMFHTECLTGTSDVTTTVICPFCQHSNQSSRKSAPSRFNRHGGASGDMGSRPDKSQGLSSQQFETSHASGDSTKRLLGWQFCLSSLDQETMVP